MSAQGGCAFKVRISQENRRGLGGAGRWTGACYARGDASLAQDPPEGLISMALIPHRLVYGGLAASPPWAGTGCRRSVASGRRSGDRRGPGARGRTAEKDPERSRQGGQYPRPGGSVDPGRVGEPPQRTRPRASTRRSWVGCARLRSATPRPGARSSGSPGRASWRGSIGSTCRWCLIG